MSILKVVSFALIALFIYLLFKDKRSDLALLISLVAGTLILIFTIGEIQNIVLFLKSIANKAGIDIVYI